MSMQSCCGNPSISFGLAHRVAPHLLLKFISALECIVVYSNSISCYRNSYSPVFSHISVLVHRLCPSFQIELVWIYWPGIEGRFNNRLYKLVIFESRSTRVVDIVLDTGCETLACW